MIQGPHQNLASAQNEMNPGFKHPHSNNIWRKLFQTLLLTNLSNSFLQKLAHFGHTNCKVNYSFNSKYILWKKRMS